MSEIPRPIPESYWVEPGRLLAGEYPGHFDEQKARRRVDAFLEAGLDTFIDLTTPGEVSPYSEILKEQARAYEMDVSHYRFPIRDFGLPTNAQMRRILDQIDESLQAGRKVYVHCWGGIGRTGTTIGCYLVRRGLGGNEALRQLARWWQEVPKSSIHPRSPETLEQAAFVLGWAGQEYPPNG
ncbi:MAG: fused DSP-PTPase phosphatase/NAD kinase-like protein [Bacteroidota bacterium]